MGRVRYLGDAGGKVQLLRHGSFAEFGDPRKRGQQLKQLSYPVGYRYAYQPPLTCGACGHRAPARAVIGPETGKTSLNGKRVADPTVTSTRCAPPA